MNAIPMIDAALLYIEGGSPVRIDTAAGEAACSDVADAVETLLSGKPVVVRREWDRVKAGSRKKAMHMGTIYYLAAGKR